MTARKASGELRVPPHSVDAEQCVLGGLMLDEQAIGKVQDWLAEKDFYRKDHQLIYRAIMDLAARKLPCDAVTMGEWFESNGLAETVGGASYVIKLANSTPSAANVEAYAEIVSERAKLRQLIDIGTDLCSSAFSPGGNSASLIASKASAEVNAFVGDSRVGGLQHIGSAAKKWMKELFDRYERDERITGVATPFGNFNEATMGLQPGELYVVVARPGMGKTVLCENIVTFDALRGNNPAMFSLEMPSSAIVQRQVSSIARIPHRHLQRPDLLSEEEWSKVSETISRLNRASMHIDDKRGIGMKEIVARAKKEHRRKALSLIAVDHLGEVKKTSRLGPDRVSENGDICRGLKDLAYDCRCPVLLLVQLTRAVLQAGRHDHRPNLSDIRGGGEIEEVADVIMFMHREDYYDKETHMRGVVEIDFGKGRNLQPDTKLYFENHYSEMRLKEWEGALPSRPEIPKEPSKPKGLRASKASQ